MANHTSSTELVDKEESELNPLPRPTRPPLSSCHKILILIACCALVTSGYTYYTVYQMRERTTQSKQLLASSLHQLSQQQNRFEEKNTTTLSQLNEANATLQNHVKQLNEQVDQLREQTPIPSQDWLLLKARHYMELAQINAHWNAHFNDASTTVLLEQADQILAQIHSAKLFKIREILAQEILETKVLQQQDLSGLLNQLAAIQQKVDTLTLTTLPTENNSTVLPSKPLMPSWKLHFENSLDVLKQLVIIRHVEQDTAPLLSPLLESLFKESIRLNLQEAQWAVINANPKIYALALAQATNTLKKYGTTYHNTAFLLQQLTELSHVDVAPPSLSVGKALPLLNALITKPQEKRVEPPIQKTGE